MNGTINDYFRDHFVLLVNNYVSRSTCYNGSASLYPNTHVQRNKQFHVVLCVSSWFLLDPTAVFVLHNSVGVSHPTLCVVGDDLCSMVFHPMLANRNNGSSQTYILCNHLVDCTAGVLCTPPLRS